MIKMARDIEVKIWEDETGKPILNLTPMKNKVVNLRNQYEYDNLMKIYETGGMKWTMSKKKPTELNLWPKLKENTCITADFSFESKEFTYGNTKFYINENTEIVSFEEYIRAQAISPHKASEINSWYEKYGITRESKGTSDFQTDHF
jgi:hypothetical protein